MRWQRKNVTYSYLKNWGEPTLFVPLHAKKPKTRISPPRAERGTECPGIAIGCPSVLSNRPCRGPIRTQPTKAQTAK